MAVFITILPKFADAQPNNWTAIDFGEHVPYIPRFLHYSENLDLTLYGGYFFNENHDPYFAGYDGTDWIPLSDTLSGTLNNAVDYGSGIMLSGFGHLTDQQFKGVAIYDGVEWSFPWYFDNNVTRISWANDTLYAIGLFTEINESEVYRIARLVDGEWEGVLASDVEIDGMINDLVYYDGDIYIGGLFQASNGVEKFAKIVNGELVEVAGGLPGANTAIRDMEVYNGELYLAGIIPQFQGNVGNHIIRYNGESFEPVGEPLTRVPNVFEISGNVWSIFSFNGYLYARGTFHYAGEVPMYGMARWDGEIWCGLFANGFLQPDLPTNNTIYAAHRFQNEIIVYLPYYDENDDQIPLWKYEGGDEVEFCTETLSSNDRYTSEMDLEIFPNPGSNTITIKCNAEITLLTIFDARGRMVKQEHYFPTNGVLDISSLQPGIYQVWVQSEDGYALKKIVVF